jgi:membrane protease YdiL (CAAX protease family)
MSPSREQILASSAGWVAVVLNVVPGLGAGYLYQRRWKAYWVTTALATAWFLAGAVLAGDADAAAQDQNQLVGLIGLLALAGVTATEAALAVKRVREGVNQAA